MGGMAREEPRRDASAGPDATDRPAGGRGAPGRVAEVHAQTRHGLVVAVGFTVAAIISGIARAGDGWWVPLHLFVVGGLLSAISAVTQMLAVTWSAAPAPHPAAASAQRWSVAGGAIAMIAGHEADAQWLFVAGGATVVVAVIALVPILLQVRSRAVTDRFAPAIEAYVAAVVAGAVGMSLGIVLGAGHAGSYGLELRGAHLVLNAFGLVGLVIAGTLPYFAATQVRAKMSPRATSTAMRLTFGALAAATAVAATGEILDRPGIVTGGLIAYALGLAVVCTMLPVYGRRRLEWAGPRAAQLLAGIAWWIAMTIVLAIDAPPHSSDPEVLQALVIGGFAQILVASLAYLGPVLRGGGHQRLTAGFTVTRSWVSFAAGNVAAVAALVGHRPTLLVALAVWLADIVVRAGRLLVGAGARADGGT